MGAAMDLSRLTNLLRRAQRAGCGWTWLDGGVLSIGVRRGEPRYSIDFAREALVDHAEGTAHGPPQPTQPGAEATGPASSEPELCEDFGTRGRRVARLGLVLEGKLYPAGSNRDLLRVSLEAIERARPGTLDKLAAEKGRSKRAVARERDALYANPTLARFAEEIAGGWWMATNNSAGEVERFIQRAADHAGVDIAIRRSP